MATSTHFGAACNTMVASKWTLFLARIFGKKFAAIDDWAGERTIVICYRYRGKLYLTDMHKEPLPQQERP